MNFKISVMNPLTSAEKSVILDTNAFLANTRRMRTVGAALGGAYGAYIGYAFTIGMAPQVVAYYIIACAILEAAAVYGVSTFIVEMMLRKQANDILGELNVVQFAPAN
jgi:cation transporter-like permease